MDFTKYVALLEAQSLFFSRADKLGDPHEGSMSPATIDLRRQAYRNDPNPKTITEDEFLDKLSAWYRDYLQLTFVSCWHMNNGESDGMWQLYAKSGMGVAITTTYEKLCQSLPSNVFCGTVEYVDYATTAIPDGNTFAPFMFKRRSFQHEQETRAIIQHARTSTGPVQELPPGTSVSVILNDLLDAVYVSPRAPTWYVELVRSVSKRYGLNNAVDQSLLDSAAIF